MRVGTLAYATEQGLGYLAKSFYDVGIVNDIVVVEHSSRPTKNWYPMMPHVPIREVAVSNAVKDICHRVDLMLFFETPFDWSLIEYCRKIGTKTALMPMFECMPKTHPIPDVILNPSLLDYEYYGSTERSPVPFQLYNVTMGVRTAFTPVPCDTPWNERKRANIFVHNAGHGGLRNRNGTPELLEALRYVESPLRLIVRSQEPLKQTFKVGRNMTVDVQGSVPYNKLWSEGDVFVFPEKFNGLSLPLQEAHASGMLVMCGARFPMTAWLPEEPMIPVSRYVLARIGSNCKDFEEAVYDPKTIAKTMDSWYGRDISEFSKRGWDWGSKNSWAALLPKYRAFLETI